jgi:hypothetical protein
MYLSELAELGVPLTVSTLSNAPKAANRCANPIDDTARAIITAAQDTSLSFFARGVDLVWSILRTYYPAEATKVAGVVFVETGTRGLLTTRTGTGPTATGVITVGRDFIEHTTEEFFARRVLQVGHELQHIDQYRAGLIGPAHKAKREFLAHYWTAITPEPPGTGCVNSATRVAIIDCALAYCYCMSPDERAPYAQHERRLLELRSQLQPRTSWPPGSGMPSCPPPGC